MLTSFQAIEDRVKTMPRRRVVVPAAANTCILEAALEANRRGLAEFTLIDARTRLQATLDELGHGPEVLRDFTVIEEEDCVAAARLGVSLVRTGEADLIGKGRLQTFELMKAVLDKTDGLRAPDSLLCDVMVIEQPYVDPPRLVAMTDPALCVAPSVDDLVTIARTCVPVVRRFGVERPRVAFLAALEVVKDAMPATGAAAEAARRLAGADDGLDAEGPLSFDIATSAHAAAVKKQRTPVAGRADLLVVPNLEAGNILAKTIAVFTKAEYGHMILGARVPVVMSSRSDSSESKFNSILLALLCAGTER